MSFRQICRRRLAGTRYSFDPFGGTNGSMIDLASSSGRVVVFAYPRTGWPVDEPFVPDGDHIPRAAVRRKLLATEFSAFRCRIFGLSTQDTEYQKELADRLRRSFPVLSDLELKLITAHRGMSDPPRHYYDDFFLGILAPERRASLKATATACLRLFTLLPLLDFSLPCLYSFMTLWTLPLPLEPELEPDDFVAMIQTF